MAVDFLLKRAPIEKIIPEDTAIVAFNSGQSLSWSAWIQIISAANLTYDFILCGAYAFTALQLGSSGSYATIINLQVGTGGVDSEIPIAESNDVLLGGGTGNMTFVGMGETHFFEPVLIPAGTRIAVRATNSQAITIYGSLFLFGYLASEWGLPLKYLKDQIRYIKGLCSQTQGAACQPSPGGTNVTSGGSAYAYGSWTQFLATVSNPIMVTGALAGFNGSDVSLYGQAKIGIGSPSNEVAMSKLAFPGRIGFPTPCGNSYLPRPLYVKSGESVSIQLGGVPGVSKSFPVALKYYNLK